MTKRLKTAKELSLTQAQYCGLVKTLEALESGKLDHENDERIHDFDMSVWDCGTARCIGGSAELRGRCSIKATAWAFDREGERVPLYYLFYPEHVNGAYSATTKQAAVALRHYLMTGKENWKMAMETPR